MVAEIAVSGRGYVDGSQERDGDGDEEVERGSSGLVAN